MGQKQGFDVLLLATNTRVGSDSPWRNIVRIESLGHGKRLEIWVELDLKTNSCILFDVSL
jgi:hypothetical protein